MYCFNYLEYLFLLENEGVEVMFEIESSPNCRELVTTTNNQQPLLPNLQRLYLRYLKSMSHVWKCNNWNKFLSLEKQSSFQNLTTIQIWDCNRIRYLFSPLMVKLLSDLKTISIFGCYSMEEVVSNRDDKHEEMTTSITHTTTTFFPHLQSLEFGGLKNLKLIGGGVHDEFKSSQAGVPSWSLCQYTRKIDIGGCDALSRLIPCYAVGQMQNLQVLKVTYCESLMEIVLIMSCNLLKHVFPFSSLESLTQLEELIIRECKVIVKKENGEQKDVVVFPRVKCIELSDLPNIDGFFLGMNEFQWPLLEKVMLNKCPRMMVFTSGQSTIPKLKYIHTRLGKHSLECTLTWLQTSMRTPYHERL
ncbi:hypothetical protein L1987_32509 [Smallanthus sonchifolius]|uniref:Uncharacterized protein n=1 Tax=Smallanthus sonchifolius TaxID=185202 RepID=A0ACB9HNF6_9ASTR|nr:hypothetical protein L1987_32509 [Smallanthus sonchifolius]